MSWQYANVLRKKVKKKGKKFFYKQDFKSGLLSDKHDFWPEKV